MAAHNNFMILVSNEIANTIQQEKQNLYFHCVHIYMYFGTIYIKFCILALMIVFSYNTQVLDDRSSVKCSFVTLCQKQNQQLESINWFW